MAGRNRQILDLEMYIVADQTSIFIVWRRRSFHCFGGDRYRGLIDDSFRIGETYAERVCMRDRRGLAPSTFWSFEL